MPTYEYECKDCRKDFTVILTIKEYDKKPQVKCNSCESNKVQKKFTGFYAKTDKKS